MPEINDADPKKEDNQPEIKKQDDAPSQKEDKAQESWWDNLSEDQKQEVEKTASQRGFKSVKDFWQSYREAEKKISNQGETLGKAKRFEETVVPILRVIQQNPELLKQVQDQLKGNTTMSQQQTSNTQQTNQPTDNDVRSTTESLIVSKFETAHGIDKLDEESRKEVRQIIGKNMARFVDPQSGLNLSKLESHLEDALILAKDRDDKLKNMLGAISKQDEHGKLPSQSSSNSDDEGKVELTEAQKKAAAGLLGGDLEKYTQGVKKVEKTYK